MADHAVNGGGPAQEPGPEQLVARVEELSARLEQVADPFARAAAEDLVGAIMDLYGEGFERIVAALLEAGDAAAPVRAALLEDGVVASLLLIHDLYPVPLEERVEEALETVRPYLESHGGDVELPGVEDGVAQLRLEGSCNGCPASSATLELAIKQALEEAAPDLRGARGRRALAGAPALAEDAALGAAGGRHRARRGGASGRAAPGDVDAGGRRRRRDPAGLPQRVRRAAGRRSTPAAWSGASLELPVLRVALRPARRRAGRWSDGGAPARAGAAAARRAGRAGRRGGVAAGAR